MSELICLGVGFAIGVFYPTHIKPRVTQLWNKLNARGDGEG